MFAVVRIGGKVDLDRSFKDTFKMLRLEAPNHCIFLSESPEYKGMVEKIKDYATYGEIDKQILIELLRKRLRSTNNERIAEASLKALTGHESYEGLADELLAGKSRLSNFKKLQHVIRLSPPSKGFKSTKSHYPEGDLGYRGNAINGLLEKMM